MKLLYSTSWFLVAILFLSGNAQAYYSLTIKNQTTYTNVSIINAQYNNEYTNPTANGLQIPWSSGGSLIKVIKTGDDSGSATFTIGTPDWSTWCQINVQRNTPLTQDVFLTTNTGSKGSILCDLSSDCGDDNKTTCTLTMYNPAS